MSPSILGLHLINVDIHSGRAGLGPCVSVISITGEVGSGLCVS